MNATGTPADGSHGKAGQSSVVIPELGPTGTKVIGHTLECFQDDILLKMPMPLRPQREVAAEYDDDGEVMTWRTLTDAEFAAALDQYSRELEDWKRTAGDVLVAGRLHYRLTADCGHTQAIAVSDDGKHWFWTEWTMKTERLA